MVDRSAASGLLALALLALSPACVEKQEPLPPDQRVTLDQRLPDHAAPDRAPYRAAPDLVPPWPAPLAAVLSPDGQLLVDGTIDGKAAVLALDTGAFPTAIDSRFTSAVGTTKVDLVLGPISAKQQLVAVTSLATPSAFVGAELGALVGSDVLGSRWIGLDYRTPAAYVLAAAPSSLPPAGSGAALEAKFVEKLGVPVVDALVRDASGAASATTQLMADTGSGVTLLVQSTFDKLDPSGKLPRLQGYLWLTNSGATAGFVTRLPSLTLAGGAEVKGSWAVVVPDNHHLALALKLVGMPTEFLGYPFYRSFLTLYAGPEKRYLFYPVAGSLGAGEWRRVGVELSQRKEDFRVEMVYQPSSAFTAGVTVGDLLRTVGGKALAGLSLAQALATLRGAPGTQLTLGLERGGSPLEAAVVIEDLLPEL